jgi:hypothetical protein
MAYNNRQYNNNREYNNNTQYVNYLHTYDIPIYIKKLLADIKEKKFKLTAKYLSSINITDYSKELLYTEIDKKVRAKYTKPQKQSGGKRTNKKKLSKKKKGNKKKNKYKKYTKKYGGLNNNDVFEKRIESEALEIQGKYMLYCYVYGLFIIINFIELEIVNINIYNLDEMVMFFEEFTKEDIINQTASFTNKILEILEIILRYSFIEPKKKMLKYITDNKQNIIANSNIYIIDCHGSFNYNYFFVPEKTILIINTNISKNIICPNFSLFISEINRFIRYVEQKNDNIYKLFKQLYQLFLKKFNKTANIYLPGQAVNNLNMQISRDDFHPFYSLRNNEENNEIFNYFTEENGYEYNLKDFVNKFNISYTNNLKVIYIVSCNNIDKTLNHSANYIHNYFMKLVNKYNYSLINNNNSIFKYSYNSSNIYNIESPNTLLKQSDNIYNNLGRYVYMKKKTLADVIKLYESIKYVKKTKILLNLIYYFANYYYTEELINLNTDKLNYIFSKISDIEYVIIEEFTIELLKIELKKLFEANLGNFSDNEIKLYGKFVFILYENSITIEIVNKMFKHKPHINKSTNIKATDLHYYIGYNNNIDINIVNLLIDEQKIILESRDDNNNTPLHLYLSKDNIDINIVKLLIGEGNDVLKRKNNDNYTPLDLYLSKDESLRTEIIQQILTTQ